MILYFIIILISYLIGNFSTSYIVSKKIFKTDIRTKGSKNAGTTNAMRTFGFKVGMVTFFGDFFKGSIAVILAIVISKYFNLETNISKYIATIAVVCGHNWPIFLKFKGGKGVATTFGAMAVVSILPTIACGVFFFTVVLVTGYVSLSSICSISMFCVLLFITKDYGGAWISLLLAILVTYKHKDNIIRLLKGKERRVDLLSKLKGKNK